MNQPVYIRPNDLKRVPAAGQPLEGEDLRRFVRRTAEEIAGRLGLRKRA
jgi:hypothetical protein